jgi:LysM repeat protein
MGIVLIAAQINAMIKGKATKYFLSLVFVLSCCIHLAQTKSTNIQKVNGVSYYIHKIEKGQSLYSLSKLYDVSLDDIYLINPEVKAGTKANQEIKIPVKVAETYNPQSVVSNTASLIKAIPTFPDTNLYIVHVVGKKETLYAITKKYNVSESDLKMLNPQLNAQGLIAGQNLIIREKKIPVAGTSSPGQKVGPDTLNPNIIHLPKKNSYHVALILPFRLEQSLNLDLTNLMRTGTAFPPVSALSVDFYLGFKKAVDSLTSKEFEVTLNLYDIDDKDSAKLVSLVNDPTFKKNDFIVGPLHANGFKTVAQKSKENGTPIVSPITQQNKMLYNNVYVSKTNPSLFTLLESLADYCIDSLVNNYTNILLVAPLVNDVKELRYVKAFKKYYNEKQKLLGKSVKDTVTVVKGLAGLKKAFMPGMRNVVVTLSTNQVFIADFTTQLAIFGENREVVLCGWQNISGMDNIDQEYLNQLNFTFPSQYNLTNTEAFNGLVESYRTQQNVYPSEYYFIGFDLAYYYLKNLNEHGTDFAFKLNSLSAETNYMRFKFSRPDNTTGFDNRGVYIFRYKDFKLQRTGWK